VETLNWPVTTGCENIGGGCESCPSLWEYKRNGWDYSIKEQDGNLYVPSFVFSPSIFTVSLGSDLFHKDVSKGFIRKVFGIMNREQRHIFEVLTKRSERIFEFYWDLNFTENIFVGVTVEEMSFKSRIKDMQKVRSENRYVSFLPLLGPVGELDLDGIKVATAGPEDWELKRPCNPTWIEDIKGQCVDQGVDWFDSFYIYKSKLEVEKCRVRVE
jgi:protein gp37